MKTNRILYHAGQRIHHPAATAYDLPSSLTLLYPHPPGFTHFGDLLADKVRIRASFPHKMPQFVPAAIQGLDQIAGKGIVTLTAGQYTVEIVIEKQIGQAVDFAVTHLLFRH